MRRRVLLLVVGMTTLVVLAFAIPLAILIRNNAYDDGIDGLRKETNDIALYLRVENSTKTTAEIRSYLDGLNDDRTASVQLPDGTVLGTQPPGGVDAVPDAAQGRFGIRGPSVSTGSSGEQPGGLGGPEAGPGVRTGNELAATPYRGGCIVQLRIPAFDQAQPGQKLTPSDMYTVRVFADDDTLRSGQDGPWLLLAGSAVALLVLGIVAGEILTRRIVRPLVETAATAQQLSAGDTTARAPTGGPGEVADVGRALNRLADRIDQLIAEERETTADLSHRLRTPMTALRLDAEALRDPADADRIGNHVSALERMLTAIIHAARRPQREGRMPSADATAVVRERVEFWSALAEDQGRPVSVELPDAALPVRAADEDLAAAVDALLENVIAYTPEGTSFAVRLTRADGGGVLEVSDDGPGLPADAHVRGRSDRGSTGLGLDIARRCAEASGGSMTLGSTSSGGALVRLDLRSD